LVVTWSTNKTSVGRRHLVPSAIRSAIPRRPVL
jgi:hypothetical protein